MKRVKVSALRERGLHCLCSAEPQVSESINSIERKADTMKTYILRPFPPVDAQAAPRSEPATAARTAQILGQPAAFPAARVLFIGLDVHNDSIAVSLAPSDSTEVRRYGLIGGTHDDVLKLIKRLSAAHLGTQLRFCYEAGPRGYPLCRFIRAQGHECIIVAPPKFRANRATGSRPTVATPINWLGSIAPES